MHSAQDSILRENLFTQLALLSPDKQPRWGKMSARQMVEHLAVFFDVSSGKTIFPLVTAEELLPKYVAFIYSDKAFRENTKAPVEILGEETIPEKYPSLHEAIDALRVAVNDFFNYHEKSGLPLTVHPVFGPLNEEQWVLLHIKHVRHHLKQFGLTI